MAMMRPIHKVLLLATSALIAATGCMPHTETSQGTPEFTPPATATISGSCYTAQYATILPTAEPLIPDDPSDLLESAWEAVKAGANVDDYGDMLRGRPVIDVISREMGEQFEFLTGPEGTPAPSLMQDVNSPEELLGTLNSFVSEQLAEILASEDAGKEMNRLVGTLEFLADNGIVSLSDVEKILQSMTTNSSGVTLCATGDIRPALNDFLASQAQSLLPDTAVATPTVTPGVPTIEATRAPGG